MNFSGEPKGVMIEHGNLTSFLQASSSIYGVGLGSRILQFANFTFDASILEWSNALATAATLCFAETPQALVGDYLADVIDTNSVTFMQITPTALATIPLERDLPSLSCISVGGEAVPGQLIRTWQERVDVVNSYGPTETAIAVSYKRYPKGEVDQKPVSVGKPPTGTQIFICDTLSRVLNKEQEGEICISGCNVGRGYINQPSLTARNFLKDSSLGSRLYKTGDRGALTADGELKVFGRIDRELKVRGFRIAPEMIEETILGSESGASMVSVQTSKDGSTLIAFVAPLECDTQTLLQYLREELPQYMVPSIIYRRRSLPFNANGKVDHKSVKLSVTQYIDSSHMNTTERPPAQGEVQRPLSIAGTRTKDQRPNGLDGVRSRVTEIWRHLLNLTTPPNHETNFFDVGGHRYGF